MAVMLLVGGLIVVVAMSVVGLIVWSHLQRRALQRAEAIQEAWERAEEIRQQQLKAHQEQRTKELVQRQQQQEQERERVLALTAAELQQQRKLFHRALIERELARVRRIEDIPLPPRANDPSYRPEPEWEAAQLPGADLAGRDLSSRYLRHANLRGAHLAHANLFMADLSWACLVDADLTGADLTAANLQYADLRGATLGEAQLLVTDMQQCNLAGATLLGARNLSSEQLVTCQVNETTRFDTSLQLPTPQALTATPLSALPAHRQVTAGDDGAAAHTDHEEEQQPRAFPEARTQDIETPLPERMDHDHQARHLTF